MSYQDLTEVLRESGVRTLDRLVPPNSLGLPDAAQVRLLAELGGLLRVYYAKTPGGLPSVPRLRSSLEATGYDSLALVTKGGGEFLAVHVTAEGEEAHKTLSDAEAAGLLKTAGLEGDADGVLASECILELLRLEEEPKAYDNRGLFSDDYLKHRV